MSEDWYGARENFSHLSTSLLMNLSASCLILPLMWLNLKTRS